MDRYEIRICYNRPQNGLDKDIFSLSQLGQELPQGIVTLSRTIFLHVTVSNGSLVYHIQRKKEIKLSHP